MKHRCLLPSLLALSFPLALSAQVGSVVRTQHITEVLGGFSGSLRSGDEFGSAVAGMGDIDGDGVADLAVGAPGDRDGGHERGAVWILFLNADGTVRTQTKISQTQGNFPGVLADDGYMGGRLARISDLDGDGIAELAVVSGNPYRLWILRLAADGTVKAARENLYTDPVFDPPTQASFFGNHEAPGGVVDLGDRDGDGLPEIALGAPLDPVAPDQTGSFWILHLDAAGGYKSGHKVASDFSPMPSVFATGCNFGGSITALGDLDGDGRRELGVTAPFASIEGLSGMFWILSLDANDQVKTTWRFGPRDYGLAWPWNEAWSTSHELAWLGDLDGDGLGEIALGFGGWDFPRGPHNEGGFAVGFLRADGSVSKKVRISHHSGGFGDLTKRTGFGQMIAPLGDLDGDGTLEVAVGAHGDVSAGEPTGGVWILSLARSAVRNGTGRNTVTLSQASEPVWGSPWSAKLDCSGHAPGVAVVFGFSEPRAGLLTSAGELLVGGTQTFWMETAHASGPTLFQRTLPPYRVALIDLPVFIQGACTGAPGIRLSNALDVMVGRR